jgi:hypothetical protein
VVGAIAGTGWLAAALVPVELCAAATIALRLHRATAAVTLLLGMGSAAAADGLLAAVGDGRLRPLTGVLGVGVVAALLAPLLRRRRSLAALLASVASVVLATGPAALVALRALDGGRPAALAAIGGAGVLTLLVSALTRPQLPPMLTLSALFAAAGLVANGVVG